MDFFLMLIVSAVIAGVIYFFFGPGIELTCMDCKTPMGDSPHARCQRCVNIGVDDARRHAESKLSEEDLKMLPAYWWKK